MFKLIFIVVSAAIAIVGCDGTTMPVKEDSSSAQDKIFIENLSTLIEQSDRMLVTEHSNQFDLYDNEKEKSLIPTEIIYRSSELNRWQTLLFKTMVIGTASKGSGLYSLCIFKPHHTIYFYADKRLLNKLDICFECGDVFLEGAKTSSRPSFLSMLSILIGNVGFEAKRDWQNLAKEHNK